MVFVKDYITEDKLIWELLACSLSDGASPFKPAYGPLQRVYQIAFKGK